MRLETKKYLFDIHRAAEALARFSVGKDFEDYTHDVMLRSAVERQFEIIGEALNQLAKIAPDIVSRISEYRRVIAFRNILIHAYADVDDRVVWSVLQTKLPVLHEQVEALLAEDEADQ